MNYTQITEDEIPAGVRFDLRAETQGKFVEISYGGFSDRPHGPGSPFKKVYDRSPDRKWETTEYFRADAWREMGEHERVSNARMAADASKKAGRVGELPATPKINAPDPRPVEMKKLLHRELRDAAKGLREGSVHPDVFFTKLVTLLRDHLQNLGLSERAIKYWLIRDSKEKWSEVKHEFAPQAVVDGLAKAGEWMRELATQSRAFRVRYTDDIPGRKISEKLPLLESILLKYHYDHLEIPRPPQQVKEPEVLFYTPPSGIVWRPWV